MTLIPTASTVWFLTRETDYPGPPPSLDKETPQQRSSALVVCYSQGSTVDTTRATR
ncbi:hypothetical protein AB0C22_23660 [Micromonospora sp. NPDC048894]|uniref:hypothetical protein n=1 Tax=Micromonospora sp. NPDC048894 TaxID=3155493 RepID=UPI0033CFA7D5